MAHQYMPKIFYDPHKNPPAPPLIYLMFGPMSKFKKASRHNFQQMLLKPLVHPWDKLLCVLEW